MAEDVDDAIHGLRKRTSINTKETAFDLTADDDRASRPSSRSVGRGSREGPKSRHGATVPIAKDSTPIQINASKLIDLSKPKNSSSTDNRRRKTTPSRAHPVIADLDISVSFRKPPGLPSSSPEDEFVSQFKRDETPANRSSKSNGLQKAARPSSIRLHPPRSDPSPVQKSSSSPDKHHGKPSSRGSGHALRSAFKVPSPSPVMAFVPASRSFKTSPKPDQPYSSKHVEGQRSAPRLDPARPKESQDDENTKSNAVQEIAVDDAPSTERGPSQPASKGDIEDDSARLGPSQGKGRLGNQQASKVSSTKPTSAISGVPANVEDTETLATRNSHGQVTSERGVSENRLPKAVPDTVAGPPSSSEKVLKSSGDPIVQLGDVSGHVMIIEGTKLDMRIPELQPAGVSVVETIKEFQNPISQSAMEEIMRRHLRELREDHEYFMKVIK